MVTRIFQYVALLSKYEPLYLLLPTMITLPVPFWVALQHHIKLSVCLLMSTEDFGDPDPLITVSSVPPPCSNCPCSLAAALARATADSILKTDLSIHHLNKTVEDGADPIPRESSGILKGPSLSLSQIRSFSQTHTHTHVIQHTHADV